MHAQLSCRQAFLKLSDKKLVPFQVISMPFQAKFKALEHPGLTLEKFFDGQCTVSRMKDLEALGRQTPFAPYGGDFNFVVWSKKYNLSRYFRSDTEEHQCLRQLFSSFDASEMKILQPAQHLPLLNLGMQVMDLTLTVSRIDSEADAMRAEMKAAKAEAEATKSAMEAEIEQLKRRLSLLENRDQSPKRV